MTRGVPWAEENLALYPLSAHLARSKDGGWWIMVLDRDCQGGSGTLPSVTHSQGIPRYNQEETAFSDRRGGGAAGRSQFGKDRGVKK